ncbi:MAG: hypothetical protein Q9M91_07220 [Candidatus Dojkabacteria bacterium]|nr:hypothetical protein [Candidatus Dojkabacteria bacterium]
MMKKIALEEFKYFSKDSKIKILKKLWRDNFYEADFDLADMQDLCRKYRAPPPEEFLDLQYTQNYGKEQAKSGNFQLVFTF